jgi:outer membrane cobalamin receptor
MMLISFLCAQWAQGCRRASGAVVVAVLGLLFSVFSSTTLFADGAEATLSGSVRDSLTGEVIIRATVSLSVSEDAPSVRGALTNTFGFFSIPKLEVRAYVLKIRSIGYAPVQMRISEQQVRSMKQLALTMKPVDVVTSDVVVLASREDVSPTSSISAVSVNSDFIKSMPAMLGETDVFRVLQLLPGVKSPSELSSGLYIRGGSPDQNLILLDGVTVYNPSHLGGFLSTFNNDALRDVRLIKGGFPAEYGGRLSSVLDMTMKDGNSERVRGAGGLSIISAKALLEGPIGDDVTFMLSGRRMYLDLVSKIAMPNSDASSTPGYYFYDANAKLTWKIGENDRLTVSGFFGRDVLDGPPSDGFDLDIGWGNATFNTRWMHIVSPELFTNLSVIYTKYDFKTDLRSNDYLAFYSLSKIADITTKGDATYYLSQDHTIKAGFELTSHDFTNDVSDSLDFSGFVIRSSSTPALDAALYVQDEWTISKGLSANAGLRGYYFPNADMFALEPRLQLAYELTPSLKITSSYAVAHQFLHLIVRNDINLPTDLWFPSTKTIRPERSEQFILGWELGLGNEKEYVVQVEGYYKDMQNLYEYKDTASFTLFGAPLESQFTRGDGRAYGVEFFLNKRLGDLTGWIGYTLSWTTRTFAELNQGKEYFARYDRRHDASITLSYKLSKSIDLGVSWVYGTGFAYTMPTGQFSFGGVDPGNSEPAVEQTFTDRNGYRLPAYHRLDINLGFKTTVFGLESVINLSVYNAYNRLNPFAQYFEQDYDPATKTSKLVLKQLTLFPIIPSIAWNFSF